MRKRNIRKNQIMTTVVLSILIVVLLGIASGLHVSSSYQLYHQTEEAQTYLQTVTATLQAEHPLLAKVYTDKPATISTKAWLVFEGSTDANTFASILSLLEKYQMSSAFFLSANQWVEQGTIGFMTSTNGLTHSVGLTGYDVYTDLASFSTADAFIDIASASYHLLLQCETQASMLLWKNTTIANDILLSCYACGLKTVVVPSSYINASSFATQGDASAYVSHLREDSIVCMKLTNGQATADLTAIEWLLVALKVA